MKHDLENREDLEILIEKFYDKLLKDPTISYIFTHVAEIDIKTHLSIITDFWESILFDKNVYHNNPMKIHLHLNDRSPLTDEHFNTWLGYFNNTLDELFEGPVTEKAKQRALSIATVMRIKIKVNNMANTSGTKDNPWKLKTPPGTSEYEMYRDEKDAKEIIVCTVGKTVLHYDARAINDLHAMLKKHGDWMDLGGADEQKPVKEGTVEAWGRSEKNPVGGWYGMKKGLRGRFGVYMPPLMEALGLVELTHEAKNNKIRVK